MSNAASGIERRTIRATLLAMAVCLSATGLCAQTVVKPPKNKYTPQQDVQLGREAAAEVRKQYPIIQNDRINRYLTAIGKRLVAAAPPELNLPVYEYSFTPVNLKEINAFALPGGPMFVQRGMFDAATSEAEVAGVMAHELAHVLLRHGTANATKAQNPWLQIGQIAGVVGGAVVGGRVGSAVAQGSQFGLGTFLLKYSREYEKQADLLGVQIMARAGYDPRALAHMFETIQRTSAASGGGVPEWLSSHPDPGSRTQYINKEAALLSVARAADTGEFPPVKSAFASLPAARSTGDLARAEPAGEPASSLGTPGQPVPRPSSNYRDISGGSVFRASVPSDWTSLPSKSAIKVVPQNGYGELNGQTVFACGVEFGILKAASRDLTEATNAWIKSVAESNLDILMAGPQQSTRISNRSALATSLVNPSPFGGWERIGLYTTFLADGTTLFYYLTIAQDKDVAAFQDAFRRVGASIRLTDGR